MPPMNDGPIFSKKLLYFFFLFHLVLNVKTDDIQAGIFSCSALFASMIRVEFSELLLNSF